MVRPKLPEHLKKKKPPTKKIRVGAGRPKLEVDHKIIFDLAKIHCTDEEIATLCKLSVDTLVKNFSEPLKAGREEGKASLRRHQIRLVEEQNSTSMAIWLGKCYLKQKEEVIVQTQELPALDIPLAAENQRKKKDA